MGVITVVFGCNIVLTVSMSGIVFVVAFRF